jgi:acyl carrier protein
MSTAAPSQANAAADDVTTRIRSILKEHGRLGADAATLSTTDDLYAAGMTSHANVNIMLALEGEFGVEFPDEMLKRGTFDSIASIQRAVTQLMAPA